MASEGLMRVTVEKADGTEETYVVKPATIVAFERQFAVGLGSLGESGRMEYVYWLAYDCEKRSGKVVKPFDGWLDELVDVSVDEEAAPLGGTPTAAA
jgi:hypothetical protein